MIDFAYNLIDFNPRHTKAFQYACGQTIVVKDMEVGRKLLNQARMVTLDGELFDKSGSMSGGNDNKAKMHFSSRGETDLAVLKQTSKKLAEEIRWLADQTKELNQSLVEERDKSTKARAEFGQKQADLEAQKLVAENLDRDIETVKPKLRETGDRIDNIDQEVLSLDSSIVTLTKQIDKLEETLEESRDKGKQSKLAKLVHESEVLRDDLNNVENQFKEIQRLIDQGLTEERVEQGNRVTFQTQIDELTADLQSLELMRPEHESEIGRLSADIAEMEAEGQRSF